MVVGVDGSPESVAAVDIAAVETEMYETNLRILHVRAPAVTGAMTVIWQQPGSRGRPRDGTHVLGEARRRVEDRHPGMTVEEHLADGDATTILIEESARAQLVVVGARGLGGFAGLLLGSTAVRVATLALCPVMVARGETHRPGPVVVGLDDPATAVAMSAFASREAERRRVALRALHIDNRRPRTADQSTPDSNAADRLSAWSRRWRDEFPDIEVNATVMSDIEPVEALAEASRSAGVVVIGSRRRFGSKMLGPTAYALAHRCDCPLVLVNDR